jgi:hypothetical protein
MHQIKTGYVIKKNCKLAVDYGVSSICLVMTDHHPEELRVTHVRSVPKKKRVVNVVFFVNTGWTEVNDLAEVCRSGLHLAVMPEVDGLRALKRDGGLDFLFRLADQHAHERHVCRAYVDTLCFPILGTQIVDSVGGEHIPVMQLCRTWGQDRIELHHREELQKFHPAWFTPLVYFS